MGSARLVPALSAFVSCLVCAQAASAAHPNVRLDVQRDPETQACMSERALAASVERRLGRRVFDARKPSELELRVVWSRAGRWTAEVFLSDAVGPLGTREISTEARHCSAIDDSLALVVALLVDTPPARVEPPASAPRQAVPAEAAPNEAAPIAARTAPTPIEVPKETLAPREPFAFDVSASALGALGRLPGFAPGVGVVFGTKAPRGPWLRLVGELYFSVERELDGDERVRFSEQRVGLDVCGPDAPLGPTLVELCAGLRTGHLRVTSAGFDRSGSTDRLTHAVALGGQLAWPIGTLAVVLGLAAEIPLTRDRFTVRSDGVTPREVHQPALVGATGRLGIRYEL